MKGECEGRREWREGRRWKGRHKHEHLSTDSMPGCPCGETTHISQSSVPSWLSAVVMVTLPILLLLCKSPHGAQRYAFSSCVLRIRGEISSSMSLHQSSDMHLTLWGRCLSTDDAAAPPLCSSFYQRFLSVFCLSVSSLFLFSPWRNSLFSLMKYRKVNKEVGICFCECCENSHVLRSAH